MNQFLQVGMWVYSLNIRNLMLITSLTANMANQARK